MIRETYNETNRIRLRETTSVCGRDLQSAEVQGQGGMTSSLHGSQTAGNQPEIEATRVRKSVQEKERKSNAT